MQSMQHYESFGECLKRCLAEEGMSASEAARLVGFSSRNSIFRILSGETSDDVKLRFFQKLYDVLRTEWPEQHWYDLQRALSVERLGPARYRENQAFQQLLYELEEDIPAYMVHMAAPDGNEQILPLAELMKKIAQAPRAEIIITGCCESCMSRLLVECCGEAGMRGTLTVRHYIDIDKSVVTQNILGILPLVSKPWYNARLVEPNSCPPQMLSMYRVHSIYVHCWDENGSLSGQRFLRYDETNFFSQSWIKGPCPTTALLDRWRFQLELLKPLPKTSAGPEVFVEYTQRYAELEDNCNILSIKPDAHFNCIPAHLLEQAVIEGFEQSGMVAGPELALLIDSLKQVHVQRYHNMFAKRRPTHLVYSVADMERFMRTGVLTDQFFIQRAYTVEERREIIRVLLDAMRELPYFNVHFLKEGAPPLRYEISCYEGKGVLMMDAYTGYELDNDHSEALITLPSFVESVKRFFQDELLPHYVLSRSETIHALERLLVMNIS